MASIWTISFPLCTWSNELPCPTESGPDFVCAKWNRRIMRGRFVVGAVSSDGDRRLQNDSVVVEKSREDVAEKLEQNPVYKLQETVSSLPLLTNATGKFPGTNITIGLCIVATVLIIVVRGYTVRKSRNSRSGSLADLVRHGQLKSDRRGISTPLKYDDPFNNPMIKVSNKQSIRNEDPGHTSGRDQQYFSEKESQFLLMLTPIPLDEFPQIIPLQLLQVILTTIWLKIMCTRRMVSPSVSRQNTRHCRESLKCCKMSKNSANW